MQNRACIFTKIKIHAYVKWNIEFVWHIQYITFLCICKVVSRKILFFESIMEEPNLLCIEKHRKIEDEHINEPQFVEQKQHPCKFANTIEAERNACAKNEDEDAFKYAQKEQSRAKKGRIPA